MAAQHGLSHINLLPKDSFEFSGLGKILKWTTSVGRVLVVMTEFVVILAFASRFYFDKKLNDMSETIDGKLAIIQNYSDTETQVRDILARQQAINNYLTNRINIAAKFTELGGIIPPGVTLDSMDLTGKNLSIRGSAGSEASYAQLLLALKSNGNLSKISLDNSSYDQTTGMVKFSAQITYK